MKVLEQVFLTVLNMSAAASVVIAVVLLARLLLRRAPKKWSYLMWSVVAFRLCCPVSFKSVFSVFRLKALQPAATTAVETAARQTSTITYIPQITPQVVTPVTTTAPVSPVTPAVSVTPSAPVTPGAVVTPATEAVQSSPTLLTVLMWMMIWLWLAAMIVLIGYSIYSYVKMRRVVEDAVIVRDNIYETDRIRTPFILGMFRPKIYIPAGLRGERLDYVLSHEGYHLRRRDYIVKTLAYLLLTVHWFNPLAWLSFHLMGKDMEMSCDEKVLGLRHGANKAYSNTLLSFAAPGRFPVATPLCFGESSVKSRIKNALSWQKPKTWVTLAAAVLCIAALVACATNPSGEKTDPDPEPDKQQEEQQQVPQESPEDPANHEETSQLRVDVTDLGNGVFRLTDAGDTPGLDMTVTLPENWAGRYEYRAGADYPSGITFYCKATYDETKDEEFPMGRLFSVEVKRGFVPLDIDYDWDARVLAATADYSVIYYGISDVQSTDSTREEHRDMWRQVDETRFTMSDGMLANTWNETNWIEGSVTLYLVENIEVTKIVLCDQTTSAAIRQMLESRTFEEDQRKEQNETSIDLEILVNGHRYFLMGMNGADGWTSGEIMNRSSQFATEPLTEEELTYLRWVLENNGEAFYVKVTDLGSDTFRLSDVGCTPYLDMTVKVPVGWAGRYDYKISDTGITFYCKAAQIENEEWMGELCHIGVLRGARSLDDTLDGMIRVIASGQSYAVTLHAPTDVRCSMETAEEYQSMSTDVDKLEITLSPTMKGATYNESNWTDDIVTVAWHNAESWNPVICDNIASAAIRQMLERRTYTANSLGGHDSVIYVGGVKYFFHSELGTLYSDRREGNTGKADRALSAEEIWLIQTIVEHDGYLPISYRYDGSRYTIYGYDAEHLDWSPSGGDLYFVSPAMGVWGQKFAGREIEGSAVWANEAKTQLTVQFTLDNGQTSTGAVDGQRVSFTVEMDSGVVLDKELDGVDLTETELTFMADALALVIGGAETNAQQG